MIEHKHEVRSSSCTLIEDQMLLLILQKCQKLLFGRIHSWFQQNCKPKLSVSVTLLLSCSASFDKLYLYIFFFKIVQLVDLWKCLTSACYTVISAGINFRALYHRISFPTIWQLCKLFYLVFGSFFIYLYKLTDVGFCFHNIWKQDCLGSFYFLAYSNVYFKCMMQYSIT